MTEEQRQVIQAAQTLVEVCESERVGAFDAAMEELKKELCRR